MCRSRLKASICGYFHRSLSDVRPSDIDLSSVATKLPSTEKGEDSVHFHVTGKYCKGCAQIRLRNAEEAFRVVKDETVQLR